MCVCATREINRNIQLAPRTTPQKHGISPVTTSRKSFSRFYPAEGMSEENLWLRICFFSFVGKLRNENSKEQAFPQRGVEAHNSEIIGSSFGCWKRFRTRAPPHQIQKPSPVLKQLKKLYLNNHNFFRLGFLKGWGKGGDEDSIVCGTKLNQLAKGFSDTSWKLRVWVCLSLCVSASDERLCLVCEMLFRQHAGKRAREMCYSWIVKKD